MHRQQASKKLASWQPQARKLAKLASSEEQSKARRLEQASEQGWQAAVLRSSQALKSYEVTIINYYLFWARN